MTNKRNIYLLLISIVLLGGCSNTSKTADITSFPIIQKTTPSPLPSNMTVDELATSIDSINQILDQSIIVNNILIKYITITRNGKQIRVLRYLYLNYNTETEINNNSIISNTLMLHQGIIDDNHFMTYGIVFVKEAVSIEIKYSDGSVRKYNLTNNLFAVPNRANLKIISVSITLFGGEKKDIMITQ